LEDLEEDLVGVLKGRAGAIILGFLGVIFLTG
jgi:hypothetical protein